MQEDLIKRTIAKLEAYIRDLGYISENDEYAGTTEDREECKKLVDELKTELLKS